MIEIQQQKIGNKVVTVPGSKSYTHRTFIAAALSDGECELENCLQSEDTLFTRSALTQMGIRMEDRDGSVVVHGGKGKLKPCDTPIYLGNSGTSMRLLAGVAALGEETYTLTGNDRMAQRPAVDLLDGLKQLGVSAQSVTGTGCPPLEINGGGRKGGRHVELKCGLSSQYLSSLLLIAPYIEGGLEISVIEGPVSRPYIDMTIDIMARFQMPVERKGYHFFRVPGGRVYQSGRYRVESDASQAGYFWAAAAVTGATVKVAGISSDSRQGDVNFVNILEKMGCRVDREEDGIAVTGGTLSAVDVDMADMPDVVPTLAVVAAFAAGTTVIRKVAHLKAKESDRLAAVARELSRMGITAACTDDGLTVRGGRPAGAVIDTYDDHRIAMSFAVAGLVTPQVKIRDEACVEKSFPNFWDVLHSLYE